MSSSAKPYGSGVDSVEIKGPSNVLAMEFVVKNTTTPVKIACCKTTKKYKSELKSTVESLAEEKVRQVNTE